jgi:Exonuclease I
MTSPTFFWYDIETFGLNSGYDRIAQFAGIRTDMNLNPIEGEEPTVLYCRLSPDYLPSPDSCLLTGITPQEVNAKGIPEAEFIERINRIFSRPNTIACGFNTLRFDDEFIRNALYRNFFDPYEREYSNGCSRWDIIDLVRAAHDLRPEGIRFNHKTEKGNPSFKLVNLVEDNNLRQEHAHDALSDVDATIQMARLIREKQPKLFEYYLKLRQKQEVKKHINLVLHTPVLLTDPSFITPLGSTRMVMPLFASAEQSNLIYAFDLTKDEEALLNADEENFFKTDGIVKIQINRCPFISPLSVLKDKKVEERLGLDSNALLKKAEKIAASGDFFSRAVSIASPKYIAETDPDLRIYQDGFTTKRDKESFARIRATKPEERLELNIHFDSEKANEMLFRNVARNWPEALTEEQKAHWESFCAGRLLLPPGSQAESYEHYIRKVKEILGDIEVTPEEKLVAKALLEYGLSLGEKLRIRKETP